MAGLDQVPGLAGYIAAQQGAQQQTLNTVNVANLIEQLQQRAAGNQKEQAYRAALSKATTPEEQEAVAVQFGGPEAVMKSLDRRAQIGATREAGQARLVQQKELADAKLEQQTKYAEMMHEFRLAQAKSAEERAAEVSRHNRVVEGFQAQNASTQAELKRLGLTIAQDKAAAVQQQTLDKNTQMLGTALEKAGLPVTDAVMKGVEDALGPDPTKAKAIASYIAGPNSWKPDLAVDQPVKDARQAVQKLFNITLKDRSGAAVTNQELERLKQEFATGLWKTPEQLINGITKARAIIQNHYAAVASGFGPETLKNYNSNLERMGGRVVLKPQEAGGENDPLGIRK
jgi:hypothetical protein